MQSILKSVDYSFLVQCQFSPVACLQESGHSFLDKEKPFLFLIWKGPDLIFAYFLLCFFYPAFPAGFFNESESQAMSCFFVKYELCVILISWSESFGGECCEFSCFYFLYYVKFSFHFCNLLVSSL